ncbi:MAG: hypothetical protein KGJ49_06780 [Alphaproteobacteria bacterium]|nr:hypothetical protein [Alphaproteobacteria bacterium]
MKIRRIALAIACTLVLAGCLPVTSKTPVGTTAGLGADEALLGTWVGHGEDQKDKGAAYFHFLRGKDSADGAISALMVMTGPGKSDDGWMSFTVRTATLGANRYMNAVQTGQDGKPADDQLKNANLPMLYRFGKNRTLTLYWFDEDKVKEAIAAGKIAGTVEAGNFGDVKITADAATLDAFMATPEAAKLFKVFIALKRVE